MNMYNLVEQRFFQGKLTILSARVIHYEMIIFNILRAWHRNDIILHFTNRSIVFTL